MPTGTPLEGCESGRIGTLGKRVWGNSPWVRIPLPPPAVTIGPALEAGPTRSGPSNAARPRDLARFEPSQRHRVSHVRGDDSNVARFGAPPRALSEPRPDQAAGLRANARAERTRSSTSSGRRKISSSKTSTTIHPAARSRRMRSASRRRSLRLEWKVSLWTSTMTFSRTVGEVDPPDPTLVVAEVDLPLERGPRRPAPGSPRTDARASTRSAGSPGAGRRERPQERPARRCHRPREVATMIMEGLERHEPSTQEVVAEVLDLGRVESTGEVDQRPNRGRRPQPMDLSDVTVGQPHGAVDDPETQRAAMRCAGGQQVCRLQVPARHAPERHGGVECERHRRRRGRPRRGASVVCPAIRPP